MIIQITTVYNNTSQGLSYFMKYMKRKKMFVPRRTRGFLKQGNCFISERKTGLETRQDSRVALKDKLKVLQRHHTAEEKQERKN